jgi:hypothetical protein
MKITNVLALWIAFASTLCEGFNVSPITLPVQRQKNQQRTRRFHYTSHDSDSANIRCPRCPYQQTLVRASSSVSNDADSSSPPDKQEDDASVEKQDEETKKLSSVLQSIKKSLGFSNKKKKEEKNKDDDSLTFKQRLAKMGLAAVLSYGMVSNISYSISVSLAWYIFSSRVRFVVYRRVIMMSFDGVILPRLRDERMMAACYRFIKCSHKIIFLDTRKNTRKKSTDGSITIGQGSVEAISSCICWLFCL